MDKYDCCVDDCYETKDGRYFRVVEEKEDDEAFAVEELTDEDGQTIGYGNGYYITDKDLKTKRFMWIGERMSDKERSLLDARLKEMEGKRWSMVKFTG